LQPVFKKFNKYTKDLKISEKLNGVRRMYLASNYFKHLFLLDFIWANMTSFEGLPSGYDAVEMRAANPLRSLQASRGYAVAFFQRLRTHHS
jgi:hypothetical protein